MPPSFQIEALRTTRRCNSPNMCLLLLACSNPITRYTVLLSLWMYSIYVIYSLYENIFLYWISFHQEHKCTFRKSRIHANTRIYVRMTAWQLSLNYCITTHTHTHTHKPLKSTANNIKLILKKTFICSYERSNVSSMNGYLMFNTTEQQHINSRFMLYKT